MQLSQGLDLQHIRLLIQRACAKIVIKIKGSGSSGSGLIRIDTIRISYTHRMWYGTDFICFNIKKKTVFVRQTGRYMERYTEYSVTHQIKMIFAKDCLQVMKLWVETLKSACSTYADFGSAFLMIKKQCACWFNSLYNYNIISQAYCIRCYNKN